MTTSLSEAPAAIPIRPRAGVTAAGAGVAGGLTLLIRLALHTRSFDMFGDEVLYAELGRSVISGGFPQFDGPFFLHGPLFFYLEAGWARLAGSPSGTMAWVYEMRALNTILASITAVVLVLLVTRASTLRAGIAAGLMFALEPFCIRQNDRVLLETALMMWVLLGYLVFFSLIGSESRHNWLRAAGAGALFACAVLTKDEAILLTVLPLLAAAALNWGPDRKLILLTVGTVVVAYAGYVAVVAANGQFSTLWAAKTWGIRRILGLSQTTGFHSAGGGNLPLRLIAEAGYFGTSYVILGLALAAMVVVFRRRRGKEHRVIILLYGAAGVTLAYALALGNLEEQALYLLMVPSLLIIPVGASLLGSAHGSLAGAGQRHLPQNAAAIVALTVLLGINLATCVQWLRQPDDGWARLFQYLSANVPPGTQIGATDDDISATYGLAGKYPVDVLTTPASEARRHVHYVVVEWAEIDQGYSKYSPSQVRSLIDHGQLVFSFSGRTYGQLALYKI